MIKQMKENYTKRLKWIDYCLVCSYSFRVVRATSL